MHFEILEKKQRPRTVHRYASAGKRFCDLDLRTHDLDKLISSWPDCMGTICVFVFNNHPEKFTWFHHIYFVFINLNVWDSLQMSSW